MHRPRYRYSLENLWMILSVRMWRGSSLVYQTGYPPTNLDLSGSLLLLYPLQKTSNRQCIRFKQTVYQIQTDSVSISNRQCIRFKQTVYQIQTDSVSDSKRQCIRFKQSVYQIQTDSVSDSKRECIKFKQTVHQIYVVD